MGEQLKAAAILGAGLGSRLQSRSKSKPLSPLLGETLLSRLLKDIKKYPFVDISCALRAELTSAEERSQLPNRDSVRYLFVDTESSLHTLGEVHKAATSNPAHLFVTMADTILLPGDLHRFLRICETLGAAESAVLVTPFIDDEKPLYAHVNTAGEVSMFGPEAPQMGEKLVTSGMYCLSRQALEQLPFALSGGMHKMRNYLSFLLEQRERIKTFVVQKSIDVDHPSDLDQASAFLKDL